MFTRFGSREICNVTFKALTARTIGGTPFAAGQPVFVIDTATASSMEQATTTVYAQGGRGYNRLIAWEGEKTVTFTVTDALLSPMALSVLSGAAIEQASAKHVKHIHVSFDSLIKKVELKEKEAPSEKQYAYVAEASYAKLSEELGIDTRIITICDDANVKPYAAVLDHNGSIVNWASKVTVTEKEAKKEIKKDDSIGEAGQEAQDAVFTLTFAPEDTTNYEGKAVKLDFYVVLKEKASQITIAPDSFGGYFYVEADTLFRDQDGRDLAATLTFPKVKIQSNFTISMAPNGDPQTYDFVMDAMPAYTYFDNTKKVVCDMIIVGADAAGASTLSHVSSHDDKNASGGATGKPSGPTDSSNAENGGLGQG